MPLRPPAGAPNVLIILLDDLGFGAPSVFGGPCFTPTAVFVDVVGSTELSAQVGPAAWSAILDKIGDRLFPVIYRYEGTIARFVGDEILAFFGAPDGLVLAQTKDVAQAWHPRQALEGHAQPYLLLKVLEVG